MLGGIDTLNSAGMRLAGAGTQALVRWTKCTARKPRDVLRAAGSMIRSRVERATRMSGAVLLAASLLCVAGCAGMSPGITKDTPPEEKQKLVAARAEARWQALIKGDLETAYSYLSPGSRATTSLALYKAKVKPGMWHQAKVDKITCEGELCQVTMIITYDAKRMKGIETPLVETWVIENGTPWYVYR